MLFGPAVVVGGYAYQVWKVIKEIFKNQTVKVTNKEVATFPH